MKPWVYYNDSDEQKLAWVKELIKAKVVTDGELDARSIKEVQPEDVKGFRRAHFFCGIAVWDYALNLARWDDSRGVVWTGSCPCPSFSAAGKGQGFNDPRHLWPHWYRLIRECRPGIVFGEQVNAAVGHGWYDLVATNMEAEGYAIAAAVLGAHSVGAPHIRQRLYFVADSQRDSRGAWRSPVESTEGIGAASAGSHVESGRCSDTGKLAHSTEPRRPDAREHGSGPSPLSTRSAEHGVVGDSSIRGIGTHAGESREGVKQQVTLGGSGLPVELGHTDPQRFQGIGTDCDSDGAVHGELANADGGQPSDGDVQRGGEQRPIEEDGGAGFWSACDWLPCIDGKARPVEPGTFPLAHGTPARVGRLRGYGDAIVAPVAQAFIEAVMEILADA